MFVSVDDKLLKLAREPTNLNYGEIILLSLIKNLDDFYMSNEAIAELFGTSIRTVKRWLSNLTELKLIVIYYDSENGKMKRFIRCQI